MGRARHSISWLVVSLLQAGCATTYKISTLPQGVSVYQKAGADKSFLGETPIEFEKSGLPPDKPFVLVFEKSGFESKELVVTPTDDTRTTVSVTLKPAERGTDGDDTFRRTRSVLLKVFEIQNLVAKKRYVDALTSLNALEEQEPKLPEVFMLRGSVYFMLNEQQLAKNNWEKALELDPALSSVQESLANLKAGETQ